jgi:hypothetical protein
MTRIAEVTLDLHAEESRALLRKGLLTRTPKWARSLRICGVCPVCGQAKETAR